MQRLRSSAGGRHRGFGRRRIAGAAALGCLLVLLVVWIALGCGGRREPADGAQKTGEATRKLEEAARTTGTAKRGGGSDGQQNEEDGPYAAIPPPPDAQPLWKTVNGVDTRLERIAVGADTGGRSAAEKTAREDGTAERSVPLGRTLLAGKEDNSEGPLEEHRLVAYYGTPLSAQMGVLGEFEPEEMMERLEEQAAAYSAADPERPAVPAIEFIASIAQRDPGADGLYVSRTPPEVIEEYASLAEENDALLMLDVQLGRATILQEIEVLRPFLERPYVHLAIDPEYAVEEGQVPGVDLGTVDGAEIAEAVRYLDGLVEEKNLPDKVLLLHQFAYSIVTNKELIEPTENVEVVLHADGFGSAEDKFEKYRLLVREQPIQYGGFKVFYKQDNPVLGPERVLQLDPVPAVVTYQ